MEISANLALQIASELTRKGYLQEIGVDCQEGQAGCEDCPEINDCHTTLKSWFLTEKGKKVSLIAP